MFSPRFSPALLRAPRHVGRAGGHRGPAAAPLSGAQVEDLQGQQEIHHFFVVKCGKNADYDKLG